MIFADTDVLIDFLARREPAATSVAQALNRQELATTTVTRYELLAGARTPQEKASIMSFLDALQVEPLDPGSADRAADIFRTLETSGKRIETGDCLIAGIVLHHHGTLLTRNRRHFERIEGLTLV